MKGFLACFQVTMALAFAACGETMPAPEQMRPDAPEARCGDGECQASETLSSCPQDCSKCGDGMCTGNETQQTCAQDCGSGSGSPYCGDGVCNGNETASSCAVDCAAQMLVQNESSYYITGFYFQACGSTTWTTNVLSPYTINPSTDFTFTGIPPGCYAWEATAGSTHWDHTATLNAGEIFTWTLQN